MSHATVEPPSSGSSPLVGREVTQPLDDDLAGLLGRSHDDLRVHEEWLVFERERQRQLRMHALEALSTSLCRLGRYPEAITPALTAVRAEPLRESARRALISAHLDEGNTSEAVRQLDGYRQLLDGELGLAPSEQLIALVHSGRVKATDRDAMTTQAIRPPHHT